MNPTAVSVPARFLGDMGGILEAGKRVVHTKGGTNVNSRLGIPVIWEPIERVGAWCVWMQARGPAVWPA